MGIYEDIILVINLIAVSLKSGSILNWPNEKRNKLEKIKEKKCPHIDTDNDCE